MLDYSLIKYSLKLIKKHVRLDLYLDFTINFSQIYFFFFSVNEIMLYDDL